jgi:hypothetical protein
LIARISASTIVSPQGYYMFEEDEDEEDEGGGNTLLLNSTNTQHYVSLTMFLSF